MATAAKLPDLHPETQRVAAYDVWTDNPNVAVLFDAIGDLRRAHGKVAGLRLVGRPFEDNGASAIGDLTTRRVVTGYFGTAPAYKVEASGAVLTLWQHVEDIRDNWLQAKTAAAGLHPAIRAHDEAHHTMWRELDDAAPSVEEAYAAFERGVA